MAKGRWGLGLVVTLTAVLPDIFLLVPDLVNAGLQPCRSYWSGMTAPSPLCQTVLTLGQVCATPGAKVFAASLSFLPSLYLLFWGPELVGSPARKK